MGHSSTKGEEKRKDKISTALRPRSFDELDITGYSLLKTKKNQEPNITHPSSKR